MKWKILLLALLMACSCATTTEIYQNGFPLPQESDTFCDMSSSFCGTFTFTTYYEESPESVYPKHLPLREEISLPAGTQSVTLDLWIRNSKGWRYTIVKAVKVNGQTQRKTLYSGNAFDKRYQLQGPIIPGARVKVWAIVYINKKPLFVADGAHYKCRREKGGETAIQTEGR